MAPPHQPEHLHQRQPPQPNSAQHHSAQGVGEKAKGSSKFGNIHTVTFNNLVWVPKNIQQRIVKWYHSNLQHARINQTINSIGQTFTWKGLSTMVKKHILTCASCQRNKCMNKKVYGKIPLTSALRDKQPWEVVHINCCGPWKIRWHDDESGRMHSFEIHLLSMVDACTAWSKFCRIKMESALATSSGFDRKWLCRYPRPRK